MAETAKDHTNTSITSPMRRMNPSDTPVINALFRPTDGRSRRDNNTSLRHSGGVPRLIAEFELVQQLSESVSAQKILATGIVWKDLLRFLSGKIAWMAPDVYICAEGFTAFLTDFPVVLLLAVNASGQPNLCVHVSGSSPVTAATVACDFMVRLLATSEDHEDVFLKGCPSNNLHAVPTPISGAALSHFFRDSSRDNSNLRMVHFSGMALSEEQCLALATMPRCLDNNDVEIRLSCCSLADDGRGAAAATFIDCLRSDRGGPVSLFRCKIRSHILTNVLTGNSRVTRLKLGYYDISDPILMSLLFGTVLASNRGLVDLDLRCHSISDESWSILCHSLEKHPTLISLDLRDTRPTRQASEEVMLEQKRKRTRAIADLLEQNTVLQTVHLSEQEREGQIHAKLIQPRLEMNLYRARVLAIKDRTQNDGPFREKLFGRALHYVRSNPNLVQMFLSQNMDVVLGTYVD
jgi:hypothetical protein